MNLIELININSFLILEFAKKTNISKKSFYRWTKNPEKIKLVYRAKIAKALNMELQEFEKKLDIEMEKVK